MQRSTSFGYDIPDYYSWSRNGEVAHIVEEQSNDGGELRCPGELTA